MKRFAKLPLRAPRLTLAVMLACTAMFASFLPSIRVDSSLESLLPTDDPQWLYYEGVKSTFGDESVVVVGILADDVFSPSTLAKIDRLSRRLQAIPGIREVVGLSTVRGIQSGEYGVSFGPLMKGVPGTATEAAAFRAAVLDVPIYLKNVVSPDGKAAAFTLLFEPMSDAEFRRRGIEEQIRGAFADLAGPERFAVTGLPTIKVQGERMMEEDIETFTPLALLFVVAVLVAAFRTRRGVLVPLLPIVISVVWTTGLMAVTGTAINLGTLVLNPLLIVIGIASGIHLLSQYLLEAAPGRDARQVVAAVLDHVSVPIVVAGGTTLIGFGSLMLSPIHAVRQFGAFSVFGIVVILLSAFTVVPAVLVLLRVPEQRRVHTVSGEIGWLVRGLESVGTFAVRRRRDVLLVTVVLAALSVWGISRIPVETDYLAFFRPGSPVRTENALIARHLAGTQPVLVVIDGSGSDSVTRLETLRAIERLQRFLERQPGVDATVSVIDYLLMVQRGLVPDAAGRLPDRQGDVEQLLMFMDATEVRSVLNADASRANVLLRTSLSRSGELLDLVHRIEEFAARHFPASVAVHPTGSAVLLAQTGDRLVWGQLAGLWQELLVLFGLLALMFLSLRVGLLALVPNVLPTVFLFGVMGWAGIGLNVSTSMIAAIAIGIAIDDTIHLLSAFNHNLRTEGRQDTAIVHAMGSAGQAAFLVSVALSAGFLVVCFSNFQPVRQFGLLASATMGIALVVELFVTPALVTTTKIITLWDLLFLKLGPEPHRQIPLFAELQPFQVKVVVLMGRLRSVPAGAFIARRGDFSPELYVILRGNADVVGSDGRRRIRRLGRGDLIGEMGLVRRRPRSAHVIATEEVEYFVLDERVLSRLQRRYPRIASRVLLNMSRILSDRLEATTNDLVTQREEPAVATVGL